MKPIETTTTNLVFKGPRDWDVEKFGECKSLPLACSEGVFYSYWAFSFVERVKILFGRPIRLAIFSSRMPPIALETADPQEL